MPEQVVGVRSGDNPPMDSERLAAAQNTAIENIKATGIPQVIFTDFPKELEREMGEKYTAMPISRADDLLRRIEYSGEQEITFNVYGLIQNELIENTDCRISGEEVSNGVTAHIEEFWGYFANSKNYWARIEATNSERAVAELKERYAFMYESFVPYLKKHAELSAQEDSLAGDEFTESERQAITKEVTQTRFELNAAQRPEQFTVEKHSEKVKTPSPVEQPNSDTKTNSERSDKSRKVYTVRDEMVQTIIEHIKNNTEEWQMGWRTIGEQRNAKSGKLYRGINAFYLSMTALERGYKDTRWVTYNQAQDMKAHVKFGEKGVPVLFYELYDKNTKKEFRGISHEKFMSMSEEERASFNDYVEKNVCSIIKYTTVFNAEQCENMPEFKVEKMSDEERANKNDLIETIIVNSPTPIYYDGGDSAYYSLTSDTIHLPEIERFNSMQDFYATALHEIAHSTGHESRLNRLPSDRDITNEERAIEELRVELSSVFLQSELGIQIEGKHISNHAAYLRSWLSQVENDPKIFYTALRDAEKITGYVISNYLETVKDDELEEENEMSVQNVSTNTIDNADNQTHYEQAVRPDNSKDLANGAEIKAQKKTNRSASKNVKLDIELPENSIGGVYRNGKSTMLKMPSNGEYGRFVTFVPSAYLHSDENTGKRSLTVLAEHEYLLQSNGLQVTVTGLELSGIYSGQQIGKAPQCKAPSSLTIKTLDQIDKNVPEEIKAIPKWAAYFTKWNAQKGKKDKVILSPVTSKWIHSNVDSEWTDYETAREYALKHNCAGLTVMLTKESGISCIDLDKCIDKETGEMKAMARKLTSELKDTYTEKSTSGNGLHIFVKDDIRMDGKYKSTYSNESVGDLEVLQGRPISLTGDMVSKTNELSKCPIGTMRFMQERLGEQKSAVYASTSSSTSSHVQISDKELISWIERSKKGADFRDMYYRGVNIKGDSSRTDAALANIILYHNHGDINQALDMFKRSAIYRPDKSDDYYLHTLNKTNEMLFSNNPAEPYAKLPKEMTGESVSRRAGNRAGRSAR